MIPNNEFTLFDPQEMDPFILPDEPGNYIILLRSTSSLPINTAELPIMTLFEYKKKEYEVVYVGKSSKSLRSRDYYQHFNGTAGNSTVRKSIGCLLGFQLIPRDINSPQNKKTKFNENDERTLTEWMAANLLLLYYANDDYANMEQEMIRMYNPPLNLQGNFNKINMEFRKELSALRSCSSSAKTNLRLYQQNNNFLGQTYCNKCGINLTICDNLKNEKYVVCPSCAHVFKNPFYIQDGKKHKMPLWKIVLIMVGIALIIDLSIREENSSTSIFTKEIGNNGNKKGPTQMEAMAGVRFYLKYRYLKDPDSYREMSWGPFGIYSSRNNTYFALHKYRAKNSYGGYVIEEKLFVLDSKGNVIKIADDINEIINGD